MPNICSLCHRFKPDNPSRYHRDCWYKIHDAERRAKYCENVPQAAHSGSGRKNKRHGIVNAHEVTK
jgi:hypothetical protein